MTKLPYDCHICFKCSKLDLDKLAKSFLKISGFQLFLYFERLVTSTSPKNGIPSNDDLRT